uniref:Uncharacterized protein n=1 Tax=Catharus ustulatus TaxID=91951 RepID=A0A8C3UNA2_CATUS
GAQGALREWDPQTPGSEGLVATRTLRVATRTPRVATRTTRVTKATSPRATKPTKGRRPRLSRAMRGEPWSRSPPGCPQGAFLGSLVVFGGSEGNFWGLWVCFGGSWIYLRVSGCV